MKTNNSEPYINSLIQSGTPHSVTYSGDSVTVDIGGKKIHFSGGDFSPKELAFIGWAKRDIITAAQELNLPERKPIFYHIEKWEKSGFIGEMAEIDISSAYWNTARKEGLLTSRVFDIGETVKKDVRLVAFGSAAAIKKTFVFDGKHYTDFSTCENEYGRRAYFYVASKVVALLRDICNAMPGAAALWWVDAIVCRPEYADFVRRKMFEAGHGCKVLPLDGCRFEISDGAKKWTVTERNTGREKCFREFDKKRSFKIPQTINRFLAV